MVSKKLAMPFVLMLGCLFAFLVSQRVLSQEPPPPEQDLEKSYPKKPPYSPYADRHFPERVYWGDTHLHTSFLDGRRRVRLPSGPPRRLPFC